MTRPGPLLAVGALGASLLGARGDPADGAFVRAELEVVPAAPEACPAAPELARAVEARLGRKAIGGGSAELVLRVEYSSVGGARVVRLALRTSAGVEVGERELRAEGPGCEAFRASLPLVIALMIDLRRAELPPPPSANSGAPAKPAAAPRRARTGPTPLHVEPVTAAATELRAWVFGAASTGLLPNASPGLIGAAGISPGDGWWAGVEAAAWWPSAADRDPGARVSLFEGGPVACSPALAAPPFALRTCAAGRGGLARFEGIGWDRRRAVGRVHFGVLAGPSLEVALTESLALGLAGRAGAVLTRDHLYGLSSVGERVVVWTPPPVWGELGLGLILRSR
ncbi:MAG: hypothetical protein IT376_09960 [Polyangiaceae bacterium]|nr:hypothetical protein [Polyangiaceae bacterium]